MCFAKLNDRFVTIRHSFSVHFGNVYYQSNGIEIREFDLEILVMCVQISD